jgi:hypothetical protein
LCLDAGARHLSNEPLQNLIVQRVPFGLQPLELGRARVRSVVPPALRLQRGYKRGRIEQQLQQRIEEPAEEPHQRTARVDGVIGNRVIRLRRGRQWTGRRGSGPAQLLEQFWIDIPRLENRFETTCREILNLLGREFYSMLLGDTIPNLPHDLLDIDLI